MIRASLRPSRLLAAGLVLAHTAAAATVFPLEVDVTWKALLAAAILASLVRGLHRHALLRSSGSIVELEIHDREYACVRTLGGEWREARILGTTCVTPALTAINLKVNARRTATHALLVRDNVNPEDFRKIRVLLRWAQPKPADSADHRAVAF
jgi:hypothetical protein